MRPGAATPIRLALSGWCLVSACAHDAPPSQSPAHPAHTGGAEAPAAAGDPATDDAVTGDSATPAPCSPAALAAVAAEAETLDGLAVARCAELGRDELVVALDAEAFDVVHAVLLRGGVVRSRVRVEPPSGFEAVDTRCAGHLDLPAAPSLDGPLRSVPLASGLPVVAADVRHDVCGVACGTLLRERLYVVVDGAEVRLGLRADVREAHYVVSNELAESYDCGEWDAELSVDETDDSVVTVRGGEPSVVHRWDGRSFTPAH